MKILILEMTAEEMKANRTMMDTIVETLNAFCSQFSCSPNPNKEVDDEETEETEGTV